MDHATHADRFRLTRLDGAAQEDNGADVVAGLTGTPRTLPCRYFYDEAGSALFERICETPEYYPTRTERGILEARAGEIAATTGPCELVELGSGSASKTRLLLAAYARRNAEVHFAPIDVSGEILEESSRELVAEFEGLSVRGFAGTYEQALAALHPPPAPARMFLFLGSTIGNFTESGRARFLRRMREAMAAGEYFLLGFDRHKDSAVLEAAYNDAAGLTARFNLNILSHLNARFDGDFDPSRFAHRAFYDVSERRIEMHLESRAAQTARLRGLDLAVALAAGETIRTEISRKFEADALVDEMAGHGFERVALWSDAREWFSLGLFRLGAGGPR